jgi:hypothetical protein
MGKNKRSNGSSINSGGMKADATRAAAQRSVDTDTTTTTATTSLASSSLSSSSSSSSSSAALVDDEETTTQENSSSNNSISGAKTPIYIGLGVVGFLSLSIMLFA